MSDTEYQLFSARHEAGHAAWAFHVGLPVDQIQICPGSTVVSLPFPPARLTLELRRDRRETVKLLSDLAGLAYAGAIASHDALSEADADLLEEWQAHYLPSLGYIPWEEIVEAGQRKARVWLRSPDGGKIVRAIMRKLLDVGQLDAAGFRQTMRKLTGPAPPPRPTFRSGSAQEFTAYLGTLIQWEKAYAVSD